MSAQLAQALRELRKWLNEEPNRPIDRVALARVLFSHEASPQTGQKSVASDLRDALAGCLSLLQCHEHPLRRGAMMPEPQCMLDARAALAAHEAAPQQEPDCWAILTPNGSKLVSPDEAKGRKDAYPLYAAPQQAQAPKVAVCDFVQVDDSSKSSRSQHDADSAELRSLCKARDEARRERGMLRAELAGHEASSGHLSAMVDELRALLAEAMAMMKALHESASPDDGPEMNAIVPAGAFREFVDANAALMHKIHISPHGDGAAAPQQGGKT